jgi:hypothetical protein
MEYLCSARPSHIFAMPHRAIIAPVQIYVCEERSVFIARDCAISFFSAAVGTKIRDPIKQVIIRNSMSRSRPTNGITK